MVTKPQRFDKKELEVVVPPKRPDGAKGSVYDTYKDTEEKGLILTVTDKGAKTYYLYRKVLGRPERIKLGRFDEIGVTEARRLAKVRKGEIASGKNPNEEKKRVRSDITFGEMFEMYMERYSKKFKKSWKYDEREVNKFLSHWFKRKAASVKKEEVIKLHEKLHDNNGLYQANRILERIRAIYNKHINEWGWEGSNPALGVKKFPEKSRDRFLQPEEIPCFFQALNEEENETAGDMLMTSLLTGARKTNVLKMRWEEISFQRKVWRIPETKNGDSQDVILSLPVIVVLERRRESASGNSEWVFPSESRAGYFVDPKKAWERLRRSATILLWEKDDRLGKLVEKAKKQLGDYYTVHQLFKRIEEVAASSNVYLPKGLTDLRIHDLRRSLGSWQAATGATTAIIGKTLGHRSLQSTKIYERLHIDPVRDSVDKAVEKMLEVANEG